MALQEKDLLEAYRIMSTIRQFESRVDTEFQSGNIPGFVHDYSGQEAVATGACMHLTKDDYVGSTHRGHGHCIAKGCDIKGMMAEIMGRSTGLCRGKGGSMHIADINQGMLGANAIVGGAPPLAIGAALSAKTLGTKNVSLSFTGDGGSNQGTVFESMNLAVVLQLPTIFMFENNGYGEHTAAKYAVGSGDIAGRAAGFGMPAKRVDGLDFFAVYDAVGEAVERARSGGGPSAIEASAVRFGGHFIGDPQLYRGEGEHERNRRDNDCIKIFSKKVISEKMLKKSQLNSVDKAIAQLIDAAVEEGLAAPWPAAEELLTDVYSNY
jgi:TPP-dependent pyruvate/acetoin dehydrogenase alpha subunit